jgi:hypothetical protein
VKKPATTNAEEPRYLVASAKTQGVFLVEAKWTRFQPIAHVIKGVIDEGGLGFSVIVHADLSTDFDIEIGSPVQLGDFLRDAPDPRPKAWRRCNLGLVSVSTNAVLIVDRQIDGEPGDLPPSLGMDTIVVYVLYSSQLVQAIIALRTPG